MRLVLPLPVPEGAAASVQLDSELLLSAAVLCSLLGWAYFLGLSCPHWLLAGCGLAQLALQLPAALASPHRHGWLTEVLDGAQTFRGFMLICLLAQDLIGFTYVRTVNWLLVGLSALAAQRSCYRHLADQPGSSSSSSSSSGSRGGSSSSSRGSSVSPWVARRKSSKVARSRRYSLAALAYWLGALTCLLPLPLLRPLFLGRTLVVEGGAADPWRWALCLWLALASLPRWTARAYADDTLRFGAAATPERLAAARAVFGSAPALPWLGSILRRGLLPFLRPATPAVPHSLALQLAFHRLHGGQQDDVAERTAAAALVAPASCAAAAAHRAELWRCWQKPLHGALLKLHRIALVQLFPGVATSSSLTSYLYAELVPGLLGIPAAQSAAAAVAPLLLAHQGPGTGGLHASAICSFCGRSSEGGEQGAGAGAAQAQRRQQWCTCGRCQGPRYCSASCQANDFPRHRLVCAGCLPPAGVPEQ